MWAKPKKGHVEGKELKSWGIGVVNGVVLWT